MTTKQITIDPNNKVMFNNNVDYCVGTGRLGLALTEKWQWIAYIAIRAAIAVVTVFLLYLPLAGRGRNKPAAE